MLVSNFKNCVCLINRDKNYAININNAIYACKHKSDTNSVCIDKQKEILKNVPRLQRGKNVSSIIKTQI